MAKRKTGEDVVDLDTQIDKPIKVMPTKARLKKIMRDPVQVDQGDLLRSVRRTTVRSASSGVNNEDGEKKSPICSSPREVPGRWKACDERDGAG